MNVAISYRNLKPLEMQTLEEETRRSPHIGFIRCDVWKKLGALFVAIYNKQFVGVCAVVRLQRWIKIGPLLVLRKYHGKGIGKQLLEYTVKTYNGDNLYIGTSNPRVVSIVKQLHFTQTPWRRLPFEVKFYLITYLFQRFNWEYIIDAIRKKCTSGRWRYFYFIKMCNPR